MNVKSTRVKWLAVLVGAALAGGWVVHAAGAGQASTSKSADVVAAKPDAPSAKPPSDPKAGNESDMPAWALENLPEKTIRKNADGLAVITNASSLYVLVNKKRNLPSTYIPQDLVTPNVGFSFSGDSPKKKMRKEAAAALEKLFAGAKKAGITLKAVSGYRSYVTQKALFDNYAKKDGIAAANRYSAHPGQSEHQTGLAMDVSAPSVKYQLDEKLGETKEGQWLASHAAEYGFVIRYPKGKESITGYSYEPWHVRYVGQEAATVIARNKLTLEQYFDALEVSANK
ncbi:M15 family metallopeptidase [Cohnella candidum]|uniref:D-alanyl-D-alanine carboxypeptidase family protein n=1 Tax=Cohnella candidum TaxID=2674991 RepID=A0A3G3JT62_9BACL|nr:M15 family metallopeptidase [Cohnella candidum]AYQ71408.1 D-alanyl-D-alanine carboxypeptidase family protein [Cohnella candidum]